MPTVTFSESDRVQIRRWLGFSATFTQADPRLENAITNVQAIADGGTRPDDSTVIAALSYLTKLTGIEAEWIKLTTEGGMQANRVDELTVDPLRGLQGLKQVGRIYVGHLADIFDTRPRRDVFSAPKLNTGGMEGPFPDYTDGFGRW